MIGVQQVAFNQYLGYTRAEAGKVLVSLYLIGINQSDGEASFNPFEFEIVDGAGQVHGKAILADKEPTLHACTVIAHGTCEGWWTTQILDKPASRATITLRWHTGLFSPTLELPVAVGN